MELSTRFLDDCVANLRLLEESVGDKRKRQPLEPFHLDPTDATSVEDAARHIGEFIGLPGYRFVISFYSLHEHTAGTIELRDDVKVRAGGIELRASFGDVCFIRLAKTIRQSANAVHATLAHEITHKYLQVNRVPSNSDLRHGFVDEILTDIASVWLGLGKLVLNGCESDSVHTDWSGTRTAMTHQHVGYLTRIQFALVYLLVSANSGLSEQTYENGLGADALTALRLVRRQLHEGSDWPDRFMGDLRPRAVGEERLKPLNEATASTGTSRPSARTDSDNSTGQSTDEPTVPTEQLLHELSMIKSACEGHYHQAMTILAELERRGVRKQGETVWDRSGLAGEQRDKSPRPASRDRPNQVRAGSPSSWPIWVGGVFSVLAVGFFCGALVTRGPDNEASSVSSAALTKGDSVTGK